MVSEIIKQKGLLHCLLNFRMVGLILIEFYIGGLCLPAPPAFVLCMPASKGNIKNSISKHAKIVMLCVHLLTCIKVVMVIVPIKQKFSKSCNIRRPNQNKRILCYTDSFSVANCI